MNLSYSHRAMLGMLMVGLSAHAISATPIFTISPFIKSPAELIATVPGTAIYQVTNNTAYNLSQIGLYNLPAGVSQVTANGASYCTIPITLNAQSNCLLKLHINSSTNVKGGPVLCYRSDKPTYCSQPFSIDQVDTQIQNIPIPQACIDNSANFTFELTQSLEAAAAPIGYWGIPRNHFQLKTSNPNLAACVVGTAAGLAWQQQRILAAAAFWIQQKINYCHHYSPDWITPVAGRSASQEQAGYCSPWIDLMPGTPYYNQMVRWNYSGTASETSNNWVNNNYMWRGVDCSNYTALLYDFALNIQISGDVKEQAGQAADGSLDNMSPNQQTLSDKLDPGAGKLVCSDNTLEDSTSLCDGHGGYISVIKSDGGRDVTRITANMLNNLHPGDLLYIAASLTDGSFSPAVTHVVMWTGKKVGTGTSDIDPALIAPNGLCPQSSWQAQTGAWVITDSHYQGADYRVFSSCFYAHNLWGVRRIIH